MHHTDCGLQTTDDVSFADLVEQATGRAPAVGGRAPSPTSTQDVRESMRLIRESPYLLSNEVRGTVYDVDDGAAPRGRGLLPRSSRSSRRGPAAGPGAGASGWLVS